MVGRPRQMISLGARWLVGGVFVFAGLVKASEPAQFIVEIDRFRMTPPIVSQLAGLYLPWLEIVGGGALALGRWRTGAALLVGTMLLVFLSALSSAWIRGLDISCGCFGQVVKKSSFLVSIGIDVFLLFALWVGLWKARDGKGLKDAPLKSDG